MRLQIGDTVGAYRILSLIGTGGQAHVFQAEHVITKRVEAMKVLVGGRPTPEQETRFLREIQLQASLSHPNIAAVHNAFYDGGDLVMVMELIGGETLQALLARERLSASQPARIARDVLAALEHAHSHGVVHRDVSPANVILTPDGTVKLTDFGLAKSNATPSVTVTGNMAGSLHYVSPEQVRGEAGQDPRSDLYSTGAVLFQMLTGRTVFQGSSTFELMQAHVGERPTPPAELDPSIDRRLSDAVMKALEKRPEDRYASAAEFRDALSSSPVPGSSSRFRRIAVSLAAGLAALTGLFLFGGKLTDRRDEAAADSRSPAVAKEGAVPAAAAASRTPTREEIRPQPEPQQAGPHPNRPGPSRKKGILRV